MDQRASEVSLSMGEDRKGRLREMPRVTVVIPMHNREGVVGFTLDSVRDQTFRDWECIVVDDHSSDNSMAVAQDYAALDDRFRVVSLPDPKRYQNAARNYGLSMARGEFVDFLDSDDLMTRDKLARQVEAFERDSSLDVVTCRHISFTGEPTRSLPQLKFAPQSSWLDIVWAPGGRGAYGCLWQAGGPLWRVGAVRAIGGWNEAVIMWADAEIHVRAILHGLRILRLEEIMLFIRADTPGQNTRQPHEVRYEFQRNAILTAWRCLEEKGQVTRLRKQMCSTRFYHMAAVRAQNGNLLGGLRDWFRNTRAMGVESGRVIYGGVLLVVVHFRRLWRIHKLLRPRFFAHLDLLPPALPDVDSVPVDLLPSSTVSSGNVVHRMGTLISRGEGSRE